MSALDDIRERVANPLHPAHRTRSTSDRTLLLGGLDAVLNLHECDPDFGKCTDCDDEWPCRTVRAISDALDGDK